LYTIPSKLSVNIGYEHQWISRNSACPLFTLTPLPLFLAVGLAAVLQTVIAAQMSTGERGWKERKEKLINAN